MKSSQLLLIPFLFFSLMFSSCEKEELPENPYNPSSYNYTGYSGGNNPGGNNPGGTNDGNGRVIFWSDFYGSPISVYVGGVYHGEISSVLSSSPSCGASGCVTVTLSPGTYSFSANDGTYTWSSTITVSSNTCSKQLLTT